MVDIFNSIMTFTSDKSNLRMRKEILKFRFVTTNNVLFVCLLWVLRHIDTV
jgi:hypothetical protein